MYQVKTFTCKGCGESFDSLEQRANQWLHSNKTTIEKIICTSTNMAPSTNHNDGMFMAIIITYKKCD